MAQQQNRNNNDLNDRHYSVLERLEALEVKNRILKEEIALLKSAKHRHYLLIGLLYYMLLPVANFSCTIYLCVTKDDPWFLFNIVCHGLQLFASLYSMTDWLEDSQEMCEPLRELLEMSEAQEAVLRDLRREEEAIRRYQEQLRRQREMAGRGRNVEDDDLAQCTICLEQLQFNLYENVAILACQHIFHRACIQLWLPHKDTCPVCRTKIDSYYCWRIPNMDDVDD